MASEPEDDLWMKLLALVASESRKFATAIADEGRRWDSARRQLAAILRQEALEHRTMASAERSEDRQRMDRMERQMLGLEDSLDWIKKELDENGSRG